MPSLLGKEFRHQATEIKMPPYQAAVVVELVCKSLCHIEPFSSTTVRSTVPRLVARDPRALLMLTPL